MKRSPFTFRSDCEVCGEKPAYRDVGMCAVCTHGTASALWDWVEYDYEGKELQLAVRAIDEVLGDPDIVGKNGKVEPVYGMLMHIDAGVLRDMKRLKAKTTSNTADV